MGLRDLEKLLTKIKRELQDEGQILDMGRAYVLSFICLTFTAKSGGYVDDELYHAKRDQDPILPGEHGDESLETAADEVCKLLKRIYDWETVARPNDVGRVDVTVIRDAPRLDRIVWVSTGGGGQVTEPDDPMIMF